MRLARSKGGRAGRRWLHKHVADTLQLIRFGGRIAMRGRRRHRRGNRRGRGGSSGSTSAWLRPWRRPLLQGRTVQRDALIGCSYAEHLHVGLVEWPRALRGKAATNKHESEGTSNAYWQGHTRMRDAAPPARCTAEWAPPASCARCESARRTARRPVEVDRPCSEARRAERKN